MTEQDNPLTPPAADAAAAAPPVETVVNSTAAPTQASKSNAAPRRNWLGYLTLTAFLLLTGVALFLLYQLRTEQEGLGGELSKEDREIAELNTQMADLAANFKTLNAQMATVESHLATEDGKLERVLGEQNKAFNDRLTQVQSDVSEGLQQVHRILGKTRSDWLVADAEYLLGAALQRLHLVGDLKTAILALEGADERLREAGDPAVFKVREQLANEIRMLKSFTPPDLIGASSRLLALEAKIKELPLFLPHAGKGVSQDLPGGNPIGALPDGDLSVDGVLSGLEKYVAIRRLNKPIGALLAPEQTAVLRETLLLKLETVRIALVRGDEGLYKLSLDNARAYLQENFDGAHASVQAVDTDLQALQAQSIRVSYPDIGKSLSMLRDITKLRVEADAAAAANKPADGATP